MEYFASFEMPNNTETTTYYSLYDLRKCVFGAPLWDSGNGSLLKIDNEQELLNENHEQASKALSDSNTHTSGICLKFYTNSHFLTLFAKISRKYATLKMLNCGAAGFDLYKKTQFGYYHLTVIAPEEPNNIFCHTINIGEPGEIIIYFPCYSAVEEIYIGINKNSNISDPKPFSNTPLAIYGNSCTQGASASRSGLAYTNILQRELDCEVFNFSFSAACRAEKSIANRIIQLMTKNDISAFIIDCSKNNKTLDEFNERYEQFYKTIRSKWKSIPIILIGALATEQYDIEIRRIFEQEKHHKTYYISLNKLFKDYSLDTFTIDGTHYTDIGMIKIANAIKTFLLQKN